jgi:hypothetical protein
MKTTQVTPYSALPNSTVRGANGSSYAYRDTAGRGRKGGRSDGG